ncbi:MAG: hypothetical protein NTW04_05625, partial [Elusimicrobia bacterium]|nr:hypothetical protein [Elusimicrobiota bacterium]
DKYKGFIKGLPSGSVEFKDLKKTVALINNARADMFHYLEDGGIKSTTNKMEGMHSKLKQKYRNHCGMSKGNRESYLRWYFYFKNKGISNTF